MLTLVPCTAVAPEGWAVTVMNGMPPLGQTLYTNPGLTVTPEEQFHRRGNRDVGRVSDLSKVTGKCEMELAFKTRLASYSTVCYFHHLPVITWRLQ